MSFTTKSSVASSPSVASASATSNSTVFRVFWATAGTAASTATITARAAANATRAHESVIRKLSACATMRRNGKLL